MFTIIVNIFRNGQIFIEHNLSHFDCPVTIINLNILFATSKHLGSNEWPIYIAPSVKGWKYTWFDLNRTASLVFIMMLIYYGVGVQVRARATDRCTSWKRHVQASLNILKRQPFGDGVSSFLNYCIQMGC